MSKKSDLVLRELILIARKVSNVINAINPIPFLKLINKNAYNLYNNTITNIREGELGDEIINLLKPCVRYINKSLKEINSYIPLPSLKSLELYFFKMGKSGGNTVRYEKINQTDSQYGDYYESSNNNSTKGAYLIFKGIDHNGALNRTDFLPMALVTKGYDVIEIDARKNHTYNMQEIYNLFEHHLPAKRLEGLIVNAHGYHHEKKLSPTESSFEHHFLFSENFGLKSCQLLKDLYQHFKPHLSSSFEFGLLSCKAGALKIEQILEIIPELKCYFAGAKHIGQNMYTLNKFESFSLRSKLLSHQSQDCPIVEEFNKKYDEVMTKGEWEKFNYDNQYFNSINELSQEP